jgi:hypothetical protein
MKTYENHDVSLRILENVMKKPMKKPMKETMIFGGRP